MIVEVRRNLIYRVLLFNNMAENKKSFMFYCDWQETFNELPDDKAGELIKHILSYVNDENPQTNDLLIKAVFANIKATLKRDLMKWQAKSNKNRENANKRWNANASERIKPDANNADSDTVRVSVNDKVIVKVKDIKERKADFKKSLSQFLDDYDSNLIKDFFEYWSEHGEKDRKMRFEKEKSFGISRRLATWLKNSKRFEKEKNGAKKEKENAGEIIKQVKQGTYNN